jgi:hypothetical protein
VNYPLLSWYVDSGLTGRLQWNNPGWVLPKGLIGDAAINDLPEREVFGSAPAKKTM